MTKKAKVILAALKAAEADLEAFQVRQHRLRSVPVTNMLKTCYNIPNIRID